VARSFPLHVCRLEPSETLSVVGRAPQSVAATPKGSAEAGRMLRARPSNRSRGGSAGLKRLGATGLQTRAEAAGKTGHLGNGSENPWHHR
jgi:hypothetical protein